MSIKANAGSSKSFVIAPEGNHLARVFSLVEIGEVVETWEGEDKLTRKIRIGWELPNELHTFNEEKGEQPITVYQEYTISLNSKAKLRKIVEGILGKALSKEDEANFSVESLIGLPCMLQINHKTSVASGNAYAVVIGTGSVPKGMDVPAAVNAVTVLDYENWSQEVFETLPDFVKDKMKGSTEFKKLPGAKW